MLNGLTVTTARDYCRYYFLPSSLQPLEMHLGQQNWHNRTHSDRSYDHTEIQRSCLNANREGKQTNKQTTRTTTNKQTKTTTTTTTTTKTTTSNSMIFAEAGNTSVIFYMQTLLEALCSLSWTYILLVMKSMHEHGCLQTNCQDNTTLSFRRRYDLGIWSRSSKLAWKLYVNLSRVWRNRSVFFASNLSSNGYNLVQSLFTKSEQTNEQKRLTHDAIDISDLEKGRRAGRQRHRPRDKQRDWQTGRQTDRQRKPTIQP